MFFLNLPESVSAAFADRGIREADIRYTAKADVSRENQYEEIYLALTGDELCILYGHERFVGKKRRGTQVLYEVSDYKSYPLAQIQEVVIDRLYTVSSFIIRTKDEETTVCRLSAVAFAISEPLFTASVVLLMSAEVFCEASADLDARLRTSSATTANPFPASPALAASIAAFSARILVWKAISSMVLMIALISSVLLLISCIALSMLFMR